VNICIQPRAQAEVQDAADWYEGRREGLGREVLSEVDACCERICLHPGRWPVVHRDVRSARLRRFPYLLHYRVRSTAVQVLRCRHCAQQPLF
jgi:plasmid stabilization system protein ParE